MLLINQTSFFTNKIKPMYYHVISLYTSPWQIPDQNWKIFAVIRGTIARYNELKSSFVLITDDFNCRNSNLYLSDPVTPHGARVEGLTSFQGLHQLIKSPTRLLRNSAICINLAFINQIHLAMKISVHSSLFRTYHHQIVFAKSNLKIE